MTSTPSMDENEEQITLDTRSCNSAQKSISVLVAKGLIDDLGEDKKGGKEGKRYRVLPGLTMPQRTIVKDTIPKTIVYIVRHYRGAGTTIKI